MSPLDLQTFPRLWPFPLSVISWGQQLLFQTIEDTAGDMCHAGSP